MALEERLQSKVRKQILRYQYITRDSSEIEQSTKYSKIFNFITRFLS